MKYKKTKFFSLAGIVFVAGLFVWPQTQTHKANVLTHHLNIDRLPEHTKIVEFYHDTLPDEVVRAELIIPKGAISELVKGHPFKEIGSNGWFIMFQNGFCDVSTDESGERVSISCAVD